MLDNVPVCTQIMTNTVSACRNALFFFKLDLMSEFVLLVFSDGNTDKVTSYRDLAGKISFAS